MNTVPLDTPRPDSLDDQALDWFVRRGGGLDTVEETAFQAWLVADPAHRTAYARWQDDWRALDALPAAGIDALRHPPEAATQCAASERSVRAAVPVAPDRRNWWGGLLGGAPRAAFAAFALVAVVGGGLAWQHWQQPVFTAQYASARGEQLDVTLPDGSSLRLDTGTRVEVAIYRHRREVRLPEGQALFAVAPDAGRPFDVLAGATRITVVGTRFSVRNTPGIAGDAAVRVAVEEGRVRVRRAQSPLAELSDSLSGNRQMVELAAGQQLAAWPTGQPGPVRAVPPLGIAPWRENRVSFNDAPLSHALAEFARYADPGIEMRDPAVAALRITGTFDPQRPDGFARVLPQVLPVRLRERDGAVEIVAGR